jgi:hypothetical protein
MSKCRAALELTGAPAKCGNGLKYNVLYRKSETAKENRSDSLNRASAVSLAGRLEDKGWLVRIVNQ